MKPYRGFAELIRKRRKELHMTLTTLAAKVGWSVPYLSELETGVRQPPAPGDNLTRLAQVLDLPLKTVFIEAMASRRSVELDLEGAGEEQRKLAVILARRFETGLSDQEARDFIDWLREKYGDEGFGAI